MFCVATHYGWDMGSIRCLTAGVRGALTLWSTGIRHQRSIDSDPFSVAVNELIASQPKKFKDIIYDAVVKAASSLLALSNSSLAMCFFDALIDEDEIRKKNNTRMRFLAAGNQVMFGFKQITHRWSSRELNFCFSQNKKFEWEQGEMREERSEWTKNEGENFIRKVNTETHNNSTKRIH